MSPRSAFLSDDIAAYLSAHSPDPDDVQRSLIERTNALGAISAMQIGSDQAAFMSILVATIAPTFAVEIGTFTGYSSLTIARALPAGGRLLCCDVSEEWTSIAREHWQLADVDDRIDLVIAPANDTLANLDDGKAVDFAFIDADKTGYLGYFEALVGRLSERGVIAVDNTLWGGNVVNAKDDSDDTVALRAFNDHVAADERVESVIVPIGDGVTLVRLR
jgi:caffeoyl-CoA O-methyltransferase